MNGPGIEYGTCVLVSWVGDVGGLWQIIYFVLWYMLPESIPGLIRDILPKCQMHTWAGDNKKPFEMCVKNHCTSVSNMP